MSFTRRAAALYVLIPSIAFAAPQNAPAKPAGDAANRGSEMEARLALLDALDATRVNYGARQVELESLLRDLAPQLPAPLVIDWRALDRLGVDPDDEISLEAFDIGASAALANICMQLGDEFEHPVIEVGNASIVLTTIAGTAALRLTSIYDVRDLLTDGVTIPSLQAAPADATAPDASPDASPDAADPSPEDPAVNETDPITVTPGQQLLLLLTDHVDPESWVNFGGQTAKITDRDGVLIVTAPASTHRLLRRALNALRAATPAAVEIQQSIVELPRASLDRIRRKFDPAAPEIAAALAGAPDAAVLWRATVITRVNEEALIESASGELAVSDAAAAPSPTSASQVSVAVNPSLDKTTGIITLAVDAMQAVGSDRRSIKTTLTLNPAQSTAVLELPGAKDAPAVRLLVLSITRR